MPRSAARVREARAADPEVFRSADRRRYQRWQERLAGLKDGPCFDCGVKYPPYVMDFDHRPGEVKLSGIADMHTASEEALATELLKCDLVCANCHRERTWGRRKETEDASAPTL